MSSSGSNSFPVIMTAAGPQPTPPSVINAQFIASVAVLNPGYTILPGGLIEDISSTDTGAIIIIDSLRVEYINSISPMGANAFVLNLQGQMLGIPIGQQTNTSVYVVFSGPNGYQIGKGFQVSDGQYTYTVQNAVTIGVGGQSQLCYCIAVQQGSWAVPSGTVIDLVTSVPPNYSISVTNPQPGVPGQLTGETLESYQARLFQGNLAASQGMPLYLRTLLGQVTGVQPRLISILAQTGGGWLILVGGGDTYAVANAIMAALFDISTLVGSTINVTGVTNANPGKVTTDIAHGLITGQANVKVLGCLGITMPSSGGPYTVTVIDDYNFTIGVDTTGSGAWTSGGVVTPNARNVSATVVQFPDTYLIPWAVPLAQQVTISLTWNTNSPNFVSDAAIAQQAQPALANYVNAIYAGQPMNLYELQAVFQQSVANIVPPQYLTRMQFTVFIDQVQVNPVSGTGIIQGDKQGFLETSANAITLTQG